MSEPSRDREGAVSVARPPAPLPYGRGSVRALGHALRQVISGVAVGLGVYFVTNPYIVINAFINRDVLASNFGNSLAMYEIARIGEGFVRVLELSVEGATLPVVVLGAIALFVALFRRAASFSLRGAPRGEVVPADDASRGVKPAAQVEDHARASLGHGTQAEHAQAAPGHATQTLSLRVMMLPLVVPAAVFFLQFVLIGAGKPAEYGRFGIFPDTALAIGAACLLTRGWTRLRAIVNWVPAVFVVLWAALFGSLYLRNFYIDATREGSRVEAARFLASYQPESSSACWDLDLAVRVEPAPYSFPALDFAGHTIIKHPNGQTSACPAEEYVPDESMLWLYTVDRPTPFAGLSRDYWNQYWKRDDWRKTEFWTWQFRRLLPWTTPLSWANKPFWMGYDSTRGSYVDGFGGWAHDLGLYVRAATRE